LTEHLDQKLITTSSYIILEKSNERKFRPLYEE